MMTWTRCNDISKKNDANTHKHQPNSEEIHGHEISQSRRNQNKVIAIYNIFVLTTCSMCLRHTTSSTSHIHIKPASKINVHLRSIFPLISIC